MLKSPTVAIFPWGDVIEDFLEPLGLEAADFAERMSGGWLFGYVAGLAGEGIRSVIVYGSAKVDAPVKLTHAATGAPIWLVPARRSGVGKEARRPGLSSLLQWARSPLPAFGPILRREGCGAILVQDYEHARFDALAVLGRALRLPVWASFQGGDWTSSRLEARVRGRSLRLCEGLIVPSARERARLKATYGLEDGRMHDVPNPVDVEQWRAEPKDAARAALGIDPGAFLVVNHGRIDVHRKGLDVLAEAWRLFAAWRPEARLTVIGSGRDDEAFAALARATPGLDWRRGYVTDPPLIRRWLSAADAYVTLSRVEGMPVAPLEAMACGLPVVASDCHGLTDILHGGQARGGLLVPQGDPAAAAQALGRLYAQPEVRARLALAARREVEGRYAIPAVGRQLRELFDGRPGERAAAQGRWPPSGLSASPGAPASPAGG